MGTCSPAIDAELAAWVALGGGNSGCYGNQGHTYGFHRAANEIPSDDYSRQNWYNENPVDDNLACAGDFAHRGDPVLRAKHARVFRDWQNGAYPMICELIGQPIAGGPVLYLAEWNGRRTVQRYTGQGHDEWSHFAWKRNFANQRSHMWAPVDDVENDMTEDQNRRLVNMDTFMYHTLLESDTIPGITVVEPTGAKRISVPNKPLARAKALDARVAALETVHLDYVAFAKAIIAELKA